ncbi:unnamed protein product [Trichobilharzia regenti]|nr:unnamed protein product [Trichobilharzia regenti]
MLLSSGNINNDVTNQPFHRGQQLQQQQQQQQHQRETVLTLYPFVRNQVEELSFSANEILEVLDKPPDDPDWWRCRNNRGEIGLVPQNYVRVLTTPSLAIATGGSKKLFSSDHKALSSSPCQTDVNFNHSSLRNDQLLPTANSNYPYTSKLQCTDGEALRLSYATQSSTGRLHADRPWCWGIISRADCEEMLGKYSLPGEFIVRDSESHVSFAFITRR